MVYPRPQLVRSEWQSLEGSWHYAFSESQDVETVTWGGEILVPYPPEAAASGVGDTSFHPVVWYQRTFEISQAWTGKRTLLHFGAVDYAARVWVNGQLVATHEGGHTPFSADITHVLTAGEQTIVVRAEDDPFDMAQPRGKQDWQREPHAIWYPRTTGIWQPVWLEPVSNSHIANLRFTPNLKNFSILCEATMAGDSSDTTLEVEIKLGKELLISDSCKVIHGKVKRELHLPVAGLDDYARRFLWSPEHPNLMDVTLRLNQGQSSQGQNVIDEVQSYTALRSVEARDGKFFLNHHPYFLRLALDQGYFDESLLAAPSSDALKKDVELAKAMGFNGVRKHQKIEDPRYLYWADKLGLLVWEEMPSAYHFTRDSVHRLTKEWLEVLERDYSHPCIVAWVCFNESWGVPDLVHSEEQQNLVAGLYHLTKSLDSSRPVVGNDGWEHVVSDLLTIHDYSREPAVLAERYGTPEASQATTFETLEHGRVGVLEGMVVTDQPVLLSEFGGIRYNPNAKEAGWGYQEATSPEALLERYAAQITAISSGVAGFCYTQFADTFQEQNGLLFSDRRPKVPLEALAKATRNGR
jgi:beta-galactosidase/beta-glucuronidase